MSRKSTSVPVTWEDLKKCWGREECVMTSRYKRNHVRLERACDSQNYLPKDFMSSSGGQLLPLQCFLNGIQEPLWLCMCCNV